MTCDDSRWKAEINKKNVAAEKISVWPWTKGQDRMGCSLGAAISREVGKTMTRAG
jgi:hypothetical protein